MNTTLQKILYCYQGSASKDEMTLLGDGHLSKKGHRERLLNEIDKRVAGIFHRLYQTYSQKPVPTSIQKWLQHEVN
jgi:hypothetical protein